MASDHHRGAWITGGFNLTGYFGGMSKTSLGGYDVYLADYGITGAVHDNPWIESVYYAGVSPVIGWTGNTFNNWGATTSRISPNEAGPFSRYNDFSPVDGAVLEVIGGMVSSTLLSLIVVPSVYSLVEHGLDNLRAGKTQRDAGS